MNNWEEQLDLKKDFSVTFDKLKFNLSDDYIEFLNNTGGAEGIINENYINLYSYAEILKWNDAYAVPEFLPNYLLIGTLNDEAIVINQNSCYFRVPFIGMFEKYCIQLASNFNDFFSEL